MGNGRLYETMKIAAKKRKIKVSPQHDLYKRVEPYFFHAFYCFDIGKSRQDEISVILDIAVKYCRFDELRWHILSPDSDLKFTDKVRANSVAACNAGFPRKKVSFPYDGSDDGLNQLCEDILDWVTNFYQEFFQDISQKYGTLEEFYLANWETFPLLAGLVHIERQEYEKAEGCFRLPNMNGKHVLTSIHPSTKEQIARVNASCENPRFRSDYERLLDYTVAMRNGVAWTKETADYGLLPKERQRWTGGAKWRRK